MEFSVLTVTVAASPRGRLCSPSSVAQTRVSPRQSAAGTPCAVTRAVSAASSVDMPRRCRSRISVCSSVHAWAWAAALAAAMRLRCTEKSLYSSTHPPTPNDAARTRISRQSSFWKYRMRELLWWGRGVGCPGAGCDGRLRGVGEGSRPLPTMQKIKGRQWQGCGPGMAGPYGLLFPASGVRGRLAAHNERRLFASQTRSCG